MLDYLFHDILSQDPEMTESHPFLRDRTRAVRQDFTMQHERGPLAIECHERIARYHILCLHVLREWENFSESQELEQLRKGKLIYIYTFLAYPDLGVTQSCNLSTSFTMMPGWKASTVRTRPSSGRTTSLRICGTRTRSVRPSPYHTISSNRSISRQLSGCSP